VPRVWRWRRRRTQIADETRHKEELESMFAGWTNAESNPQPFRKLLGYKLLWLIKSYLDESSDGQLAEKRNVG
jgi:hypothetical protein